MSVAVAGGATFSLALVNDGNRRWVGVPTDYPNASFPRGQASPPSDLTNVVGIARRLGAQCALAVRNDGTVTAWGYNIFGQTNVPTDFGSR